MLDSLGPDRVAVVQGASGGIGSALVGGLLRETEARVVATARRPEDSSLLEGLRHEFADRLELVALDLELEDSVAAAAAELRDRRWEIDLLICASGVLHRPGLSLPEKRLADLDPEAALHSLRVNTLGPLLVAKHFSGLLARDHRSVFASLSARVGSIGDNRLGGWYSYRLSKAALNMAIRTMAIELARTHRDAIVVALHPGTVDTALSRPFQSRLPKRQLTTPAQAAGHLLDVIRRLETADSGGFFAWDGDAIPW